MNEWFQYLAPWVDRVFNGFILMTPALFIVQLLWKSKSRLWYHLLLSSNILLLIAASLYALILLTGLPGILTSGDDASLSFRQRATGPYWYSYWIMILGRALLPQLLWITKYRSSYRTALLMTLFVASGIIIERLVIVLTTLNRDYLPTSWTYYTPDWSLLLPNFLGYTVVVAIVSLFIKEKPATEIA